MTLCVPSADDLDCTRTILRILPDSELPGIMIGLFAALNTGYHVFIFWNDNFYTSTNAFKWTSWYNAGYNTTILL